MATICSRSRTISHPIATTAPAFRPEIPTAPEPSIRNSRPEAAEISSRRRELRPRDRAAYSPWRTLVPTFWTPLVESDAGETVIGAATAMSDALGRHGYAVDAGWAGGRARPDWHAALRLRPLAARRSSPATPTTPIRCAAATVRSRELFAGALLPLPPGCAGRETLLAGFDAQTDTLRCDGSAACRVADCRARPALGPRPAGCTTAAGSSATRSAPRKASPSRPRPRPAAPALGSDADAGAGVFDVARASRASFGRHTVLAGARSPRPPAGATSRRAARVLGGGPGPSYPVVRLRPRHDRPAARLRRRRTSSARAPPSPTSTSASRSRGRSAAPASWPLFLHSLHGAAFVDAGHAWDAAFRAADIRTVDRRRALRRSRRPPLPAADDRRRRRVDARSRRRPPPRRVLRPHRLRVLDRGLHGSIRHG